jgi:hypothetical protein
MPIRRKVWVDASGQGIGVVAFPDLLAFDTRVHFGNSLDAELAALAAAVHLFQYEQDIPTTFYTDCQGVRAWVTNPHYVGGKSPRDNTIRMVRAYTHREGSCWNIRWTAGKRNRLADKFSRGYGPLLEYAEELGEDGRFRIYSLKVTQTQFDLLTAGRIHRLKYESLALSGSDTLIQVAQPAPVPAIKPIDKPKESQPLSMFLPCSILAKVSTIPKEPEVQKKTSNLWFPRSYTSTAACV